MKKTTLVFLLIFSLVLIFFIGCKSFLNTKVVNETHEEKMVRIERLQIPQEIKNLYKNETKILKEVELGSVEAALQADMMYSFMSEDFEKSLYVLRRVLNKEDVRIYERLGVRMINKIMFEKKVNEESDFKNEALFMLKKASALGSKEAKDAINVYNERHSN